MKKLFTNVGIVVILLILGQSFAFSQQTISGVIVDDKNIPVIGAAIYVKGTTIGTVTDIDGKYSVTVPADATALEISYLGFSTQTLMIADNTYSNITLSEDLNKLDEVVITGLASSVKRSNLANAVASIGARELTGVTSQPTM